MLSPQIQLMFWTFQKYLQVSTSSVGPLRLCQASLARNGESCHWTLKKWCKGNVFQCFFSPYVSLCDWFWMFFVSHGCQKNGVDQLVSHQLHQKLASYFFGTSAIPAIEVLGKPVSRRITWIRRPSSKVCLNKNPEDVSMSVIFAGGFWEFFHDFWGENRSEIWKFHGHEVHGSGLRLGAIGLGLTICDCWNVLPFGLVILFHQLGLHVWLKFYFCFSKSSFFK